MKPLNEWLHKDAAGDGNTTPQKQIPRGQSAFIPQKPLVSGGPHAQSAENAGKGFPLRMYPLGGFEQIGRNSFVVEVDGDIYIIDLGKTVKHLIGRDSIPVRRDLLQDLLDGIINALPYFFRVMLHPSWLWKILRKFLICAYYFSAALIVNNSSASCGALVYGKDVIHRYPLLYHLIIAF